MYAFHQASHGPLVQSLREQNKHNYESESYMTRAKVLTIVILALVVNLVSLQAVAGTASDPKEILDTSKQQFPTQKTEVTTLDAQKNVEKKCRTLKNGKVLCTEKKLGKKPLVVNPDAQVK